MNQSGSNDDQDMSSDEEEDVSDDLDEDSSAQDKKGELLNLLGKEGMIDQEVVDQHENESSEESEESSDEEEM